jgi:hypothetical protein
MITEDGSFQMACGGQRKLMTGRDFFKDCRYVRRKERKIHVMGK